MWAAAFENGFVSTFHAEVTEVEDGVAIAGVPDLQGAGGAILLPDPYSFPTDAVLAEIADRAPGVPVLGGVSSARTLRGQAALFLGEQVVPGGAIGVRFDGVELLPCVSQGATPIGPELEITSGEGRLIKELGGRPALGALRAVLEGLDAAEREMLAEGMLLGIVVESGSDGGEQPATATSSCAASSAATPRRARSRSARRSRRVRSCACTRATRPRPTATSRGARAAPPGAGRRRRRRAR